MPIRFRCPSCNQMLGIASRKAGSQIECPTCGMTQRVPTAEEAAMLTGGAAAPSEASDSSADALDTAAAVEVLPAIDVGPRAPAGADRDAFDVASAVGKPVPSDMILFRRHTFYVHGLLFLLLSLAGFGLGYLVGRGDVHYDTASGEEAAAKKQIPLDGKVQYFAEPGRTVGDKDAVIVAIPEGKTLSRAFSIQGIRPNDPPDVESDTFRRLRDFGGGYARANELGEFSMNLPQRGTYHVLLISAHARRPPRSDIDEADQADLGKYFTKPELLIERHKYKWLTKKVDSGSRSLEYHFGLDEK
jgi:phage FluMu protein Com